MEVSVERLTGYLDAKSYNHKYGLNDKAVQALARAGALKTFTVGKGDPTCPGIFYEDRYVAVRRLGNISEDGARRCGSCLEVLDESEYYPAYIRMARSAPCKMCSKLREQIKKGIADEMDVYIHEQNRVLASQLLNISAEVRLQREAEIARLSAKYEAEGETGDGANWYD